MGYCLLIFLTFFSSLPFIFLMLENKHNSGDRNNGGNKKQQRRQLQQSDNQNNIGNNNNSNRNNNSNCYQLVFPCFSCLIPVSFVLSLFLFHFWIFHIFSRIVLVFVFSRFIFSVSCCSFSFFFHFPFSHLLETGSENCRSEG